MTKYTDIFIIGGGINGTAIAADAAGRGLSVVLCEKNDLASGTSSASSKLIHGGLRYLEFYEFGLVKKALREREVLLFRAPHLVQPLEFIFPHEKHLRPAWLIRLGLFIYDHLAKRHLLPRSKSICLKNTIYGAGLLPQFLKGFSYYDCFTDDARLVILNALSAKLNSATILTRTEFISATRETNYWKIGVKDTQSQEHYFYQAKALMNVGGPWVKEIKDKMTSHADDFNVTLDKGSHFLVNKMYDGDFAYILQTADQRIIFAIPYLSDYTLIGTTDVPYSGTLDKIEISPVEEDYLCSVINRYFKKSITKKDIIWSYAGVRCLQASAGHNTVTTTRDFKYVLEETNQLPLFTVIGGKLTTHRTLAEHALDKLKSYFPNMGPAWTAKIPLPGGDFPQQDFHHFYLNFSKEFFWLPEGLALRYAKNYGSRAYLFLKNSSGMKDLGLAFGQGLYQSEVKYLIEEEWARTSDDILWRRTKLGLVFTKSETEHLEEWMRHYQSFKL